jgi:glycerol-3-phosphate dehydrogenase subunit C
MKIARPVVNRVEQANADHYSSDCPMAGAPDRKRAQGG